MPGPALGAWERASSSPQPRSPNTAGGVSQALSPTAAFGGCSRFPLVNPALAACTMLCPGHWPRSCTMGRAEPWHLLYSHRLRGTRRDPHQPPPLLLLRGAGEQSHSWGLGAAQAGTALWTSTSACSQPSALCHESWCHAAPDGWQHPPGTLPRWLVSMTGNVITSEQGAKVLPCMTLAQLALLGGSERCRGGLGGLPAAVLAWPPVMKKMRGQLSTAAGEPVSASSKRQSQTLQG